jgi:hypothetical protein
VGSIEYSGHEDANLVLDGRAEEPPELVSLEEIHRKMDPVEAERLRTVRNIGIAVSSTCLLTCETIEANC